MVNFILNLKNTKLGVIGLGYVGLPLAFAFGEKFKTVAYDIDTKRVEELLNKIDRTGEITSDEFLKKNLCKFTSDQAELTKCNTFIITVPTPINKNKKPDLSFLISASKLVAKHVKKNDVIIYESTVYPGVTEEVCVPIIEDISSLILNKGFFVGYSPERINPGDKLHRIKDIIKVTSGSNQNCAKYVDDLYASIIKAGTFKAQNIKTAEAAKVIENIQRDVNIALINELTILFKKIGINTKNVLEAASTKWNFLDFKPGLVGGHCIGVDPYYLTYKAEEVNYKPELILAGRKLNDNMAEYISQNIILELTSNNMKMSDCKILIMGITFKENCPDIRNTKSFDIYKYLKNKGIRVDVYDPCANETEVLNELNIKLKKDLIKSKYNAIIITVAHNSFKDMTYHYVKELGVKDAFIYDLKYIFPDNVDCLRL